MSSPASPFAGQYVVVDGELRGLLNPAESPAEMLARYTKEARRLTHAASAVVLASDGQECRILAKEPVSLHLEGAGDWMRDAVDAVRATEPTRDSIVKRYPENGTPANWMVIVWMRLEGVPRAGLVLTYDGNIEVEPRRRVGELLSLLLESAQERTTEEEREKRIGALVGCVEAQAAIAEIRKFRGASMAICNEIAARWGAERVSLGILKGRYVRLQAMSHSEKFDKRSNLVHDIECAMEECLDQDVEVYAPNHPADTFVNRAARALIERHGPSTACSFPLRVEGDPVGVLTVERAADRPLSLEEARQLRLLLNLSGVRLFDLWQSNRWIGARTAAKVREWLAVIIGPRYTWAKLGAVAALAFIAFAVFVQGPYRVKSAFVIDTPTKRVIPAPFDGYLKEVFVEPGDVVIADDTILATLETAELRLELARQEAARAKSLKEADIARRDRDEPKVQVARASAEAALAEIRWLEQKIQQATLVAPIDGVVLTGDLDKELGSPLARGDVLFELAPLEELSATLHVPDNQIDEIRVGQRGQLAPAANPGDRIGYEIERVHPVSEMVNGENVFLVKVRLDRRPEWLTPGVEGLAKTTVGQRRYIDIWTRKAIDWIRMRFWI